MAEERGTARDYPSWKAKPATWTKIFGTFLVALDPFKLLVAAAGIMATAFGWWLISIIFYYSWTVPDLNKIQDKWNKDKAAELTEDDRKTKAAEEYKRAMERWSLMYELAGPTDAPKRKDTDGKLSPSAIRYIEWYKENRLPAVYNQDGKRIEPKIDPNDDLAKGYGGKYRTMPWAENRGPNPFLMTKKVIGGSGSERKEILTWFFSNQVPNLVEPLVKLLTPVYYLFDARASFWVYIYVLLLIVWLLVVWAFFGGVLTRMAVMQLSGKEGGGLRESLAFVKARYLSYLCSPMIPIGIIGFLVLCCMLFGVIHWCPILGDFVDGVFWFLPLLAGLVMTLLLVGMVGYPMMYTTLSTEGSDTFDALSRSYNYVYESPWHYLFYAGLAVVYGAVLTLFVLVVGSSSTYLAKWGVARFPTFGADRSPEYLFVYAPESLGWRQLLLQGSPAAIDDDGRPTDPIAHAKYMGEYEWWNDIGAGMTSFWVTLVFLMVIGFSYSYFWTASTQVYLLMRKRVDETDLDEVYVEEDAPPPPSNPAPTPTPTTPVAPAPVVATPTPTPAPTVGTSIPIDAPTLKQPDPPPAS